jgi:hypothetical protein
MLATIIVWVTITNRRLSSINASAIHAHNETLRRRDAVGNVIETHEHAGDFKEW